MRALVVCAALAACGPKNHVATPPAVIVFSNESVDMADVFAERSAGGSPIRLGSVEAGRTAQLRLPAAALGADGMVTVTARIFARPRLTPTTGPFPLHAGERMAVRLSSDVRMLSVLPVREP